MKFETIGNNKKKVKITLEIVCVISIIGITAFTLTRASYKQTQSVPLLKGNISYNKSDLEIVAIKLQQDDGTYGDATEIPASGYILNTDVSKSYCKVGTAIEEVDYKYESGSHYIKAKQKGSKCYLSFDKSNAIQASTYLKNKNIMANRNGYRYTNIAPLNYVTFNNEVWRIIGVFDTVNADTTETESLVKIIRSTPIGYMNWDDKGSNDWTNSSLMKILNGDYYAKLNGYSDIGLNLQAQSMVQSVVWNLGAISNDSITVSEGYQEERGTKVYGNNATKWNGKVGLIYPSDYAYASRNDPSSKTFNDYYGYNMYTGSNWLNSYANWTITPILGSNKGAYHAGLEMVTSWMTNDTYQISPTLYLKSNVSILDNGKDGSLSKPYDLVLK